MRRPVAFVAAVAAAFTAAGLIFAAPSNAAPTGSFTSPAEGATFTQMPTPKLEGSFTADQNWVIDGIHITLDSQAGALQQNSDQPGNNSRSQAFSFVPTFTHNGRYVATAVATTRSPFGNKATASDTVSFTLAIPPVAPKNVKTAVDNDKRVATVTWAPNPEGDIVGYLVRRSADGGPYADAGAAQAEDTNVTDNLKDAPGGTYAYQVIALRRGGTQGETLASPASAPASAKLSPPPTTTTTAKNDGGGSATTSASASGSSGGSTSSGATTSSTKPPVIASNGKVDLSSFASLLDRQRLPTTAGRGQALEPDGEFSETLPFSRTPRTSIVSGETVAGGVTIPSSSSDDASSSPLLFLAGGMLATVVAAHVLWLKSEVDRVPLEAVAVAGPEPVVTDEPAAPRAPSRRPRPLRARALPEDLETIDEP